ncbi:MAG: hypothetical protein GMKNLPBB_02441 [Myxococcota bacterium]|nr:hypothetical protein [Myxococcota bacterium]
MRRRKGGKQMPRIIILHGRETVADLYFAPEKDLITIGRHDFADIRIDDADISRRHAVLQKEGKSYIIKDVAAKNGLHFKNQRIKEKSLLLGDEIDLGSYTLVFRGEQIEKHAVKDEYGFVVDEAPVRKAVKDRVNVRAKTSRAADRNSSTKTVTDDQRQAIQNTLRQKRQAHLEVLENGVVKSKIYLQNNCFVFGKGEDANFQVGGLFSPKVAATIEYGLDGFTLRGSPKTVVVNGVNLDRKLLQEGDLLKILGREFRFHDRVEA